MSYWIEVHPEKPTYIILCDSFLEILKKAGFGNKLDSQILSIDKSFTIIIYKNEYPNEQKSRLIGNRLNDIDYSNISKVYKNTTKIPLAFEQEGKNFDIDFNVFVINFSSENVEKSKNKPEDLGDIFV